VKGNLTKLRGMKAEGQWVVRTIAYDSFGNVTQTTDETNRTVTTTWDGTNHLFPVSVSNAAAETVSTVWDPACGVATQVTDPNGQVRTSEYADPFCRPTRTDYPLGGFEIRSYLNLGDANQQHTRVETTPATGATGNDWAESYFDGLGRTYKTKKRGPSTSQAILSVRSYNLRGGAASASEPYYENATPPQPTEYEYDVLDRLTRTVHPDSHEVERSYGLWAATTMDENGKSATVRYDAYGRPVVEERLLNGQTVETQSSYDLLGRLTGMRDAVGNTWSWTFDSLGRMTARSDPDAGSWSYSYDDAGRLLSQTDAKGQTTTFTYDPVGRPWTKTSGVGTTSFTYSESRAGFFNAGRLTTVTSPGTTLRADYDALGRAVKHTRTLDGLDYVFQKQYDSSGRVIGIGYPDGDLVGQVGTLGSPLLYDEAGRLRAIPGIVSDIDYDAPGRPTGRSNANGTQTTWTYSQTRGFLERIYTTGPALVQDLSYAVDPVGMVQQVTSPNTNEGWSYAYDDLYRLTSATNLSTPAESQSWQYDEIGRIEWNSRVGTYDYPLPGQARPHAPAVVNGNSYSYDLNGNLLSGGGRTPVWDAENRITQVGTTQFAYDGFGERIKKTASGVTSLYPLGDDYEITNGTVTKYVSIGGVGVVAKRVGSTTYWLHTDRLGNIQAITDAAGAIVQRRTYRPYGEKIADTTGHVESRGWIDQRQDETGLTYLHARYYDPATAVFLSPDPIGPRGGLNSFGYGFGNPANLTDSDGLVPCPTDGTICFVNPGNPGGNPGGSGGFYISPNTSFDLRKVLKKFWNWLWGAGRMLAASSQGAGPVGEEVEFANRTERPFGGAHTGTEPPSAGSTGTTSAGPPAGPEPNPGSGPGSGPGPGTGQIVQALTSQFVTGLGPEWTVHGPSSPLVKELMISNGLDLVRDKFERSGGQPIEGQITWGVLPWGNDDCVLCTGSLASQFVGSYHYTVIPLRGGMARFELYDTKSFWSLAYHLPVASWPRTRIPFAIQPPTPFGTTHQLYWWIEHVHR
jgi:RHS repeat-associated protein